MRGFTFLILVGGLTVGCPSSSEAPSDMSQPPMAKGVEHELAAHGDVRVDPYYWLKDRDDPAVISYLEAENAWARDVMAHTEDLQETLFDEIRGRIKKDDSSVPVLRDDYWYYTRFEQGGEYPIYCRRADAPGAIEEILLDGNLEAAGQEFFAVGGFAVSSGQDVLAYATDTRGRRLYTIHFSDLRNGELYDETISENNGNLAWAEDNRTLFYTRRDPNTLRSYQIYRHVLGTDPSGDELVYEESDETFSCRVRKTKSKRFLMIISSHTLANEVRLLDAARPEGEPWVFLARERGHEYRIDHLGDYFYVRSNRDAQNFRLLRTPVDSTAVEHWTEVVPHRDDVLLEGFELFRSHLVLAERSQGLVRLRIRSWSGDEHTVEIEEPAYTIRLGANPNLDSGTLRFAYSSMTTPRSIYDYDMSTRDRELMKQQEVVGDFDPGDYRTERLHAVARDGKLVPISLVHRADFEADGSSPLLLYAYGSYGSSVDAGFDSGRLSLLDRGFVYAVAHVRGGEELGRQWYEDGKLLKKKNTFNDFIDSAEFLIERGYGDPKRLFAQGGSAGGLLMGAIVNMRPDLFEGVVAKVPFVDIVTTMLDATIPLTSFEWDEWGDPRQREYYDYMLSYSPYDQLEAKEYPHLLVTAGLHDSQVQYFEPAKWVAKLRSLKTDQNRLILSTEMEAGHGGASGRFRRLRQVALSYAFFLDLAGIEN